MDNLGKDLLDYLSTSTLKEAKKELYQELNAFDNEVNVYYLVSLSNLKSIVNDEGIKCRNVVESGIDLSGFGVQSMRDKIIEMGRNDDRVNKKIHDCVSFFLNPKNSTFFAFQRNSLLKDALDDTYGIVCILEMSMSDFFKTDYIYWNISNKNLASPSAESGFLKQKYEKFDWQSIFREKEHIENKGRSAEFVVYYENPSSAVSNLIPTSFIKRILVSEQDEITVKKNMPLLHDKVYSLKNNNIFKSKIELLGSDKKLIKYNIITLDEIGIPTKKFCDLISTFSDFRRKLGCNLTEEHFEKKYMANSYHGIGHTIRVMFWIHVLCYLSRISLPIEEATQYAAFIHDLCRESNNKDMEHGLKAVSRYKYFLEDHVQHNHIDNCKIAVVFHCKGDKEFRNKNLVWELLKDADSLDRGRFSYPQGQKGCDVNHLRLSIFKDSTKLKKNLAWMAYRIAKITHHTTWKEYPFIDFKNEIKTSLNACLMNDVLEPNEKTIITEIVDNI